MLATPETIEAYQTALAHLKQVSHELSGDIRLKTLALLQQVELMARNPRALEDQALAELGEVLDRTSQLLVNPQDNHEYMALAQELNSGLGRRMDTLGSSVEENHFTKDAPDDSPGP